jgi:cyclopropane fatty-acyl-phospholipid synthase-like methyltransferase
MRCLTKTSPEAMVYDKNYYNTLNYTNYLSRRGKYQQTAKEISSLLNMLSLVSEKHSILDFGCATGFLSEAFLELGYSNICGYDISEWAVSEAKQKGIQMVDTPKGDYDLVFCLDVLEHMTDEEVAQFFQECKARAYVLRIPCSNNGGKSYVLDVSNKDETHINCKTKAQWFSLFDSLMDYEKVFLNTYTIYDSEGVLCCLMLRK